MALDHPHPPHHAIGNWRDFFVHIAVVAIGLLLALGLEQTAESIHHQQQTAEFEEQMAETFRINEGIQAQTLATLGAIRSYLADLQRAVVARRAGRSAPLPLPPAMIFLTLPALGPYEAAQENGTLGLLRADRIRLYKRIGFQHSLAQSDLEEFRHAMRDIRAFRQRSDPELSYDGVFFLLGAPELDKLSAVELAEYQALIGNGLQAIDELVVRMNRVQLQAKAMADGATAETQLLDAVVRSGDRR